MVSPRLAASGFALAGVLPALRLRRLWILGLQIGMLGPVAKVFLYSGDASIPVVRGNALQIWVWFPVLRRSRLVAAQFTPKALNLLRRTDNLHLAA